MLMETFRVAHLQNKFWTTNSIRVPNQAIVLDEGFKNVNELWDALEQKEFTLIQWNEFMVAGSIMLPGEWNYCFYNGKYFHLEKLYSNGFIHNGVDENGQPKGVECFFYQLIYDDWQNDWLNNRIYIKGTINLTGDKDLVKANLLQTRPLVNNVNNFEYLNGVLGEYEARVFIKCPNFENQSRWGIRNGFSPLDFVRIKNILIGHVYNQPNEERLELPIVYRASKWGGWKFNLVNQICDLHNSRLDVYDVSYTSLGTNFKPALEGLLGSEEVYTVAGISNRRYVLSKTRNTSKFVKEIDLTGITDVVELDPTSLSPRYGVNNPEPTFSISDLCRKVREKLNWGHEMQLPMEEVAFDILGRQLHYLLLGGIRESKLYRNVTVEKIERDVEYVTRDYDQRTSTYLYETPIIFKNPDWLNSIDIIPFRRWFKNGVVDVQGRESIQNVRDVIAEFSINELSGSKFCGLEIGNDRKFLDFYNRHIDLIHPAYVNESHYLYKCLLDNNLITTTNPITNESVLDNKNLALPITFKEKLVSDDGEIDFSRNALYSEKFIALIPDYSRKCHVLSVGGYKQHPTIKWHANDVQNINAGKNTGIYIFDEVVSWDSSEDVDMNTPPLDFMKLWDNVVKRGSNVWLDISRRAKAFMQDIIFEEQNRPYVGTSAVKYKTYYSYCGNNKTSPHQCWAPTSRSTGYQYQQGLFRYRITKGSGFNCHITLAYEMEPFFVRMYKKSIRQYLEEFAHIPDEQLSYTFINKNIKKGNVGNMYKTMVDGLTSQKNDNKNLISIWMDVRNSDCKNIAKRLLDIFRETWFRDSNHTGCVPWFSTLRNDPKKWEYCLIKPFRGFYYIFSVIGDYLIYGEGDDFNWLDVGKTGFTNKWKKGDPIFVANVPDSWENSGNVISKHRYILNTSEVSLYKTTGTYNTNAVIALIFGTPEYGWGNDGYNGYREADVSRKAFDLRYADNPNVLFNNFIKLNLKTDRTNNPKDFKRLYKQTINGSKKEVVGDSTINELIPPFIARYLDPNSPLNSVLHDWSNWSGSGDRLTVWREKLTKSAQEVIRLLSEFWTIFKLEGTEWYAVALINSSRETPKWEFELLTNNINNIKSKDLEYWIFKNVHKTNDVDVMINTSYELNLYGNRNGLKTRYFSDDDVLDIGLQIKALDDSKQTEASQWYSVELKTETQDVIRTILETPKEQVKHINISPYERERLLRQISVSAVQREADAKLIDIEKEQFKKMDALDRRDVNRRLRYDAYMGTFDIAQGITGAALSFGLAELFGSGGTFQALRGALRVGDAADRAVIETSKLEARYQAGMNKFEIRGNLMARQHEAERNNYIESLREASAKVSYPQLSNTLAYKIYNNYHKLNDVYLVKYYPSGELLKYLKNYYLEYGYEILVRDHECTGADSVKRHLRYTNIHILKHPKERIRNMIETRALNGIYKIDWEQLHY